MKRYEAEQLHMIVLFKTMHGQVTEVTIFLPSLHIKNLGSRFRENVNQFHI